MPLLARGIFFFTTTKYICLVQATRINIEEFLRLSKHHLLLDVRSPSEYRHAHIPGAISFPLFTDEERKIVGTAYKQESREKAIKIGLDFFGPKMRKMVEEVEGMFDVQCTMYDGNDSLHQTSYIKHRTSNILLLTSYIFKTFSGLLLVLAILSEESSHPASPYCTQKQQQSWMPALNHRVLNGRRYPCWYDVFWYHTQSGLV